MKKITLFDVGIWLIVIIPLIIIGLKVFTDVFDFLDPLLNPPLDVAAKKSADKFILVQIIGAVFMLFFAWPLIKGTEYTTYAILGLVISACLFMFPHILAFFGLYF